jgi:hypothetical protein
MLCHDIYVLRSAQRLEVVAKLHRKSLTTSAIDSDHSYHKDVLRDLLLASPKPHVGRQLLAAVELR